MGVPLVLKLFWLCFSLFKWILGNSLGNLWLLLVLAQSQQPPGQPGNSSLWLCPSPHIIQFTNRCRPNQNQHSNQGIEWNVTQDYAEVDTVMTLGSRGSTPPRTKPPWGSAIIVCHFLLWAGASKHGPWPLEVLQVRWPSPRSMNRTWESERRVGIA